MSSASSARPPPHPVVDETDDLDFTFDGSSLVASMGVSLIQTIVFVYDFVTYPIYYAAQKPWKRIDAANQVRAVVSSQSETEITYQPIYKTCPGLDEFKAAGIETMEQCWSFALRKHTHARMVGTRQIVGEHEEQQPDGKVFKKWEMGDYFWKSYVEIDDLATNFGKGLRHMGLKPQQNIAIFAETKAEWLMCALACFKQSFPLVTLYANLGDDAIAHGLNQTEAEYVITTHELLPKFKTVLKKTPHVKYVIFIEDQIHETDRSGYRDDVEVLAFKDVAAKGPNCTSPAVKPTLSDPAIIMYTSGSTGVPKGVVLPHEALVTTVKAFHFVVQPPRPGDIYLAYLPLAHILELLSEMTMIVQGIPVGYSSPNTMIDKSTKIMKGKPGDCSVLKPSLMCSVPLVIDRIYKGIQENVSTKGVFFRKLVTWAYRYKSYYRQKGMRTPILDALIFKKMRMLVGGRIRLLLSGGAPLASDTHDFVRNALELPLVQGYGLTESCACGTIMDSDELTTGRAGPPLQGVQVRLINWDEGNYKVTDKPYPRGEICLGGGNIATGYYKMPEKTKADFFKDGSGTRWFRTGDIGEIYADGTLKIVDRKKDLVKLQYGEYVSLGKVESVLKTCPLVDNICVYGESSQSFCVALLVPDRNKLTTLAEKNGIPAEDFESVCADRTLTKLVLKELCMHGRKSGLERFELPGAVTMVPELWTPESGLVTAAFKLKRKPIQDHYAKDLKRMYDVRS